MDGPLYSWKMTALLDAILNFLKSSNGIFDSSPSVTLCHTSRDLPKSTSHISDPREFFSKHSTKIPNKRALYKFSLNCSGGFCPGGFVRGLLSGRFCLGLFLSVLPSVGTHRLQQKVKHHLKFHVSYV